MKETKTLSYINNGAIDFYSGIKIETKLKFEKLCEKLRKANDEVYEKYNNYIKASFQKDVEKAISENGLEKELTIKNIEKTNVKTKLDNLIKTEGDICGMKFDFTDRGFKIAPVTIVDRYLNKMFEESEEDFDYSKNIYGDIYVSSQARFMLPPIKIKFKNGEFGLLSATLFVFKNNTAVLRITLPIDNMESHPLMSNEIDDYIDSAETLYGFPATLDNKSIESILDCYCRFISLTDKIKAVVRFKKIVNIILANHSGNFDNIKQIPNKIKEDLYKISVAPLQERKGVSFLQEAERHFEKSSYLFSGIGYVLSSMGKCISVVDNTVLDFAKENFDKDNVFEKIICDVRRNVEFTIIILLLKNVNDSYTFEQNGLINSKLSKVKNEYNKNKIFISFLQSGVYGSVRELTDAFLKNMTFFLDVKNVEDRMLALNNILEEEQSGRILKLQNVLSISGLLFTIFFGLPAINETLLHLRKLCTFIKEDLPFVSIENCSFALWFLAIVWLSAFIFFKSRTRKID
ncbi:MAG: hypothetical protein E7582_07430 [Ruminococcaceae bacterium]|nr:hypothetical protein [Oscillospiraceae bacterium]